jgi:hypothetical protein
LERIIGQIRRGETTEDSVSAWLDRSYHDSARQLLSKYLARTYPTIDNGILLRDHITDRPSAIYTLGWWMVSHIAAAPGGHDRAMEILTTPHRLFEFYNAAIGDTFLRIDL